MSDSFLAGLAESVDLESSRYAWRAWGACRQRKDLNWFPGRGESTREAKAVCATCPVKDICLEVALVNGEKHGIWGGASERERRRMRLGNPTKLRRSIAAEILELVVNDGPFTGTFSELAQAIGTEDSTVSTSVRNLIKRGLVTDLEAGRTSRAAIHTITPTTPGATP